VRGEPKAANCKNPEKFGTVTFSSGKNVGVQQRIRFEHSSREINLEQ